MENLNYFFVEAGQYFTFNIALALLFYIVYSFARRIKKTKSRDKLIEDLKKEVYNLDALDDKRFDEIMALKIERSQLNEALNTVNTENAKLKEGMRKLVKITGVPLYDSPEAHKILNDCLGVKNWTFRMPKYKP